MDEDYNEGKIWHDLAEYLNTMRPPPLIEDLILEQRAYIDELHRIRKIAERN